MKKILKRLFSKKQKNYQYIRLHRSKSGEQLYTYRQRDFGKVSSRYYRNIMEATNYLVKHF